MCTYTFTLDDKLVESISPEFSSRQSMESWLQREFELLVRHHAERVKASSKEKRKDDLVKRIMALDGCSGSEGFYNMGGLFSDSKMSLQELRDEYVSEKYGV